ncbi:MAG: hypothetical protein JSV64_01960 [Candidatus Bathyarchaeota archaeon]|nr:MAG: hypothetical protein JSV64_01960 [Candidatus Bathyarchaeota archaeon]
MAYNRLLHFFPFAEAWFASRCNSPFIDVVKGLFTHLFEPCRTVAVFLIRGSVNGEKTSILFVGNSQKAHQLAECIYPGTAKVSWLGTTLARRSCQIDKSHIDAALIDVKKHSMARFLSLDDYLVLPTISFALDLHQTMSQVHRSMSRRRRRDIKAISHQHYGYAISHCDLQDFDFFYWKMYRPYIERRFGQAAMFSPYDVLMGYYKRNGGIVFVTKRKRRLAGLLFQIRGDTVFALIYGIYYGNTSFAKNLAGTAALHFLIQWGKGQDLRWLDYGRTVPFFNNGVFRYKKEWGMAIRLHHDQPYCVLKLTPQNRKAISLLQNNPFIIYHKGELKGCLLRKSKPRIEELQRLWTQYSLPGLRSFTALFYDHGTHSINLSEFPTKGILESLSIGF